MSRSKGASGGGAAPRDSASEAGSAAEPKPLPDPAELSRCFAEIAEQSQRLVTDFLSRQNGRQVRVTLALVDGRQLSRIER